MKHLKLFETFNDTYEEFSREKNAEVAKVTNLYFHREKELTNSYLIHINEAGQELIDEWEATAKYDHTLKKFLFKLELGKLTLANVDSILKKLSIMEKKLSSEFTTITYRAVIDMGYNVFKDGTLSNISEHRGQMVKAKKTLIQVWLS